MTEALISLLGEAPKWNLRDEAVAFQRKDDIIRDSPIPLQNLHNKLAEKGRQCRLYVSDCMVYDDMHESIRHLY